VPTGARVYLRVLDLSIAIRCEHSPSSLWERAALAKRDEPVGAVLPPSGLAALRRAFHLALKAGKVGARPELSLLHENSVGKGFFDEEHSSPLSRRICARPSSRLSDFAWCRGRDLNPHVVAHGGF
jgi:hypothetical protein